VLEDGKRTRAEEGTPQGGSASPLLANIYLHYVFDLWVQAWRRKRAHGDVIVVRFADDIVLGFQVKSDAEQFWTELAERFGKFGLELHPEKTRLLEFGAFAAETRKRCGLGKPETFNFLGFTHICGKKQSNGRFTVRRQTMRQLRFPPLSGQVFSDNKLIDLGLVFSFRTGFFSRCCFPQKPAGRRGRVFGHMPAPDDAPGSLIRGDHPSVHT
jgi:hypothetical protein